ncbi:hypothetical protein LACDD01_02129 [Lactococcus sp. DD01]|nr:hypothetical protein LACDD01_02129 [Lactococcus sp. DD01]
MHHLISKDKILRDTKKNAKYFDTTKDYLLGNTTARDYDHKRLDKKL